MPPKRAAVHLQDITLKSAKKRPKLDDKSLESNIVIKKIKETKNQVHQTEETKALWTNVLWTALDDGKVEIVKKLLRSGMDVNIRRTEDNSTPLNAVLKSNKIKNKVKREELVRLMLDFGAHVNACDKSGQSVLCNALRNEFCSSELVEVLLDHSANVTVSQNSYLNDISWASYTKPELLPRLVEHQVQNEETRNNRAVLAIYELIMRTHKSVLRIIKKILDLGVPVDTTFDVDFEPKSITLLYQALFWKKKDVIKLLLEYGADPHQIDHRGDSALYRATAFKGYTHACRWLIEKGASIHTRSKDGSYPIHGACLHNSEKNIHLFLNLGASLNVTDNRDRTPFSYTRDTFYINDAHRLIIKHFALIIATGGTISNEDMERANQYIWGNYHFSKCTEQLKQMKVEYIFEKISYFSLFSENMCSLLKLMKNPAFVKSFKRDEKRRTTLFPEYSYMLLHAFEIAEKRYKMLRAEKKQLQKTLGEILPDLVIEKITYYSCKEKLKRCQYDFFMDFHANLKQTEKVKIL